MGGKNANLGEIHSRLHLPIPEGFAITTRGFTTFLSHNDLFEKINAAKMEIDPRSPETIAKSSQEIQQSDHLGRSPGRARCGHPGSLRSDAAEDDRTKEQCDSP